MQTVSSSSLDKYRCILHASFPETNAAGSCPRASPLGLPDGRTQSSNRGVSMKKLLPALLILTIVVYCKWSAAIPQDLDPLKAAADTHKLMFENQFVRVLETRVPPGKTEPWHQHGRRVVVYLSDFNTRSTERGGKPQEILRKSGLVRWSDPVIHQVE